LPIVDSTARRIEIISKIPPTPLPVPLLFVHGAWHGAWCWDRHFLDYFAAHGFAAHALSLRGHGRSAGRERLRWTRIRDYVADVAEVASGLAQAPVVIGHSMGGFVVQKYLERHAAPAAVLLASLPPSGAFRTTLRLMRRAPWPVLKANATLSLHPLVATPALARAAFFSAGLGAAELELYWRQLQDESYMAFLDTLCLDLPKPARTGTKLLILGAELDTIIGRAEIDATARAYGTRAEQLPGIAHDVMLEPGWQQAADRILAWLADALPPATRRV
jgi:pimeloyl-ACP methyl ester carboxylesterase